MRAGAGKALGFPQLACRKGKGRLVGIEAAQKAARSGAWHLKLDIRKYFESIPHDRLIGRVRRLFKDPGNPVLAGEDHLLEETARNLLFAGGS